MHRGTLVYLRRLAVALNAVSTITNGFNVLSCTFNRVASRQNQYRAAKCENCQKLFHFLSLSLSLSPTAGANHPPFEFQYFGNGWSQRSFRSTGAMLAEAFEMIARLEEDEKMHRGPQAQRVYLNA